MRYLISALFLLLPFTTHAALLFSEIAWMGTDEDQNNEWIELYNFGNEPADITGWTVTGSGNFSISLSGTIAPHGVALLERTDDASVPGVTALVVYAGALPNSGATLTLTDPNGVVADEAVGGTDWGLIGGSNVTPKKTAQRTRTGGWVTAAPTPGAENAQVSDVSEENENTDTDDDTEEDTNQEARTATKNSSSSKRTPIVKSTAELTLTLSAPDTVYVNQPVSFFTTATGPGRDIVNSLVYTWNFGDTHAGEGKAPTHTYVYPGEYLVVVNAKYGKHDVTIEKVLTVLSVGVSVSRTRDGDIVLTNTAPQEIDISGYTLTGTQSLVLPPHTRLMKGGSITIAKERVIPKGIGMVALYDRDRAILASDVGNQKITSPLGTPSLSMGVVPSVRTQPQAVLGARTSSQPSPSTKSMNDEKGEVAGTSTLVSGLTIPVYAADGSVEGEQKKSNTLPYLGLVLVLVAAIVLLYRHPQGAGGK